MEDSSYELLPLPRQRPSSVSPGKIWYFSVSGFFLGMLVMAGMLLVSWPRVYATEVHVNGTGTSLRSTGKAVNLDVNLSLHIPVDVADNALDPNVKVTCTILSNNSTLSLSCVSKQIWTSEQLTLLKASWSRAATSWYAIVLYVLLGVVILAALAWLLYPKTPEVTLESFQLDGLSTDAKMPSKDTYYLPKLAVDVNLMISLRIRNRNFIGVSYEKITLYVNYNTYQLCMVEVEGGEVAPRDDSIVNTNVKVKCAQIMYNAPNLLADAGMQELPMNLVVEFSGYVGRRWFKAPVKIAVSLDAKVDPVSADVVEQDYHLV